MAHLCVTKESMIVIDEDKDCVKFSVLMKHKIIPICDEKKRRNVQRASGRHAKTFYGKIKRVFRQASGLRWILGIRS